VRQRTQGQTLLLAQTAVAADREYCKQIDEMYQSRPFDILEAAAADPGANVRELYDYCMAETSKEKYSGLYMEDCFSRLLMNLSAEINPEAFIAMQRKLLDRVQDKSSYEAEKILSRIVDFYAKCGQPQKAWKYVEENIQISKFRLEVIEDRIKQKKFTEAKKLITDYSDTRQDRYRNNIWNEYLLKIALAEQDIPAVRNISYSFIEDHFDDQYYRIYKSSFDKGEWAEAFENLFRHYEDRKYSWGDPAADLLGAEGKAERLMEHIGKKLSLEKMEKYHKFFAGSVPDDTLALFRKTLDQYADMHTGRSFYEHILDVFIMMKKIPGGASVAEEMKNSYKLKYKNRRAMIEILNR
jgi:hypothetical protein